MKFELTIRYPGNEADIKSVLVEETNWFGALQKGIQALGDTIHMQDIHFSILADGHSAEAEELSTGRLFEVRALITEVSVEELTSNPPPDEEDEGEIPFLHANTLEYMKEIDTKDDFEHQTPEVSSKSFSVHGKYETGYTEAFLMDAFMKISNLYEHFASDKEQAMHYVLDLACKGLHTTGASILLTNINDPNPELWFEQSMGHEAEQLKNIRLPVRQGALGLSATQGITLNIQNLQSDPRFTEDLLRSPTLGIGPLVSVPIQSHGQLLGLFVLYKGSTSAPFKQGEVTILEALARSLGEYFHHSSDPGTLLLPPNSE